MAGAEKLSTEPYKGVRDFYPEDEAIQQYLFATMSRAVESFGYARYSASILEASELYRSKGAENEELVNEQTYTFTDRGGREVTLRPEMTPTAARMVAARRRELPFPLRWYSIPNVFRYERPQRGRGREHWQLNVDLFGSKSPAADVEIIAVAHAVMKAFGAQESDFVIRINSRAALEREFDARGFSDETRRAILTLLDKRAKMSREDFEREMAAFSDDGEVFAMEESGEIAALRETLAALGIKNTAFDPSIVRGFDYYTGMVFEVYDTDPQNNRSLFGGGRYDNLLALFGSDSVPAVGFGMGDMTMRDFLDVRGLLPSYTPPARAYLATTSPSLAKEAMALADELRAGGVPVAIDFGDRKLGDQIKTADKQNIPFLVVIGDDELASGTFTVRDMATGEEMRVARDSLADSLRER